MLGTSVFERDDPPMYKNEGTSIKHKKITEVAKTSNREKIEEYKTQTAIPKLYNLKKCSNLLIKCLRTPVSKKPFNNFDLDIRIPSS